MKFLMLIFALFVSLSAFTANNNSKKATEDNMKPVTAMPNDKDSTQLDDLVRGEQAAMKAYDQLLSDSKDEKMKAKLQMIRKDHENAVTKLSKYVAGKKDLLGDTEDAGAWGTFAKTWTKGGELMGNKTALKAIQQGEEHGINEYKEALKDDTLSAELKKTIQTELLPSQAKHIEILKSFM